MARVKIENGQLVITVKGIRKFFAMKSEISVPLAHVEDVSTGLAWKDLPKILEKRIGTNANQLYYGGRFRQDGDNVFYDLLRKEDAVVITLKNEDYKRLVIGAENPEETVTLIQQALKS
jgi:hypothetical protein